MREDVDLALILRNTQSGGVPAVVRRGVSAGEGV